MAGLMYIWFGSISLCLIHNSLFCSNIDKATVDVTLQAEPCQRLSFRSNQSALSIVRRSHFRAQYKEDLLGKYHDNYHYQR